MMRDPLRQEQSEDDRTPGAQVLAAVSELVRWARKPEYQRHLFGDAADQLSPVEASILEYIAWKGPLRLSDLAARQGVDKSTITPQVRGLERKGMLDRQGDPTDARASLLTISERGQALQRRFSDAGTAVFDDILAAWSREDREALGSMLTRFAEDFSRLGTPPDPRSRETR